MPEVQSAPQNPANTPKKSASGVVIPHKPRLRQRVAALLICGLVRCVAATVRYRLNDASGLFSSAPREKIIFAIWHNRLALSLMMYRRYVQRRAPERQLAAMVSASRDGGLLTRVLELFNVQPVRGSSSRRGAQALRELVSWAEAGFDLAITPDGPRGPAYQVQEGVISTAQLTGLAIVPVCRTASAGKSARKAGTVSRCRCRSRAAISLWGNPSASLATPRTPTARRCGKSSNRPCARSLAIDPAHVRSPQVLLRRTGLLLQME